MQHTWSGVDYDLIDRLEKERYARELAYVCPIWDWLKDFRDHFTRQGWWETTIPAEMERIRLDPACGYAVLGPERIYVTTDECSGEIEIP